MRWMVVCLVAGFACTPKIPARPHTLTTIQKLDGIDVDIKPEGATAWVIRAENQRDSPVRILWDESTFVDADGRSYGRLMRGRTKVIDETKAQLASTIVPRAHLLELCISEDLLGVGVVKTREGGVDYSGLDPVRKGVGRMVLVFETSNGRETWEGALSFDGSKPAMPMRKAPPKPEAAPPEPTTPKVGPVDPF